MFLRLSQRDKHFLALPYLIRVVKILFTCDRDRVLIICIYILFDTSCLTSRVFFALNEFHLSRIRFPFLAKTEIQSLLLSFWFHAWFTVEREDVKCPPVSKTVKMKNRRTCISSLQEE